MWFIIGSVIFIILVASAVWLRNWFVIDTIKFFTPYDAMAGLGAYRKYGLWHIVNTHVINEPV